MMIADGHLCEPRVGEYHNDGSVWSININTQNTNQN